MSIDEPQLAELLTSALNAPDSALQGSDSGPLPDAQGAATVASVAEIVFENQQINPSSISEGVASAGIPQPVVDEFFPSNVEEAPASVAGGFQGETDGGQMLTDTRWGTSDGYGDLHVPMEVQPMTASAEYNGCHKRKNSLEDETDAKRPEADLNRVSSELAMMIGGAEMGACDSSAVPFVPVAGHTSREEVNRPTDADILAYQNAILQEEARNRPLIGRKESLEALDEEYKSGADVFRSKIASLKETYGAVRRARGDGNCFFRSFLFAYLEDLLVSADEVERDRIIRALHTQKVLLQKAGYDDIVVDTPLDTLLGMLHRIASPSDPMSIQALEDDIRAEDVSNYIIFLLRIITSGEVGRRAEFFAPFILGLADMDVDEFCKRCIDPMGEESDHVHLVALSDALGVPIRVVYLDRSMGALVSHTEGDEVKVDTHDFIPESCAPGTQPRIHLLYRPGHYDVLYKK